jgi:hypothetical protein
MSPADLRAAGEALFGPQWQTPLAKTLDVNPRSVRHWLSGKHKINTRTETLIRSLKPDD